MKKEEFLNEIDAMINDEIDIKNLQDDDYESDSLNLLWKIREMAEKLV